MKKILCYVAIVLLIILIILPPVLRVFVKDDVSGEVSKNVVELLSCTKNDEVINMPYLNGSLANIKYTFQNITNDDNSSEILNNNRVTLKSVLEQIVNTQKVTNSNEVTYKLDMSDANNNTQVPEQFKGTIEVMNSYYSNLGYSCSITK